MFSCHKVGMLEYELAVLSFFNFHNIIPIKHL